MCTKDTPAAVRARCHCRHVALTIIGIVAALILAWVWVHRVAVLVAAGAVLVVGAAIVAGMVRLSRRVADHSVLVYQPERVAAPPRPAVPMPADMGAADVAAAAQAIADAAFDARTRP